MDIEDLINQLMNADKDSNDQYTSKIIYSCYRNIIERVVYCWYEKQNIPQRIAELEAKCYTYEKIIANSNFAPITKGVITKNE